MNDIKYGRKRKGIIQDIDAKMAAWLATIEDEQVAKAIRKDTILTGGCIASMLLGEKVNDYDIYFRTKETALLVANYYTARFSKANGDYSPVVLLKKIKNCKNVEEERVVIYIQSDGVASEEGAELQEPETLQASFIMKSENQKEGEKPKYRPVFLSANAITLSDDVQLIIRFYGEPDQIHDNFDFAHAMSYYDYGKRDLVLPALALECLLSRTLIYKGSLYPICSIFRLKKFLERGWRVTAGEQLKIMWQISELNLGDMSVLTEQLTGCDITFMYQLIIALQDVDPDKINSTYVSTIIDRIFS